MNQSKQHYLAEEPIGKLLIKFAVPCIMSLLVSSLYNIVDQIFIGQGVGYLGNGATNVVFPITIIALAIALMIGDACAAYLSICQGKRDTESSHHSVGNAIVLLVVASLVLVVAFLLGRDAILTAFGATKNNLPYAETYFQYIVIGLPFFMFGNGINSIVRADGSPQFAMLTIFAGCIINIILDPIAIFVLNWGMAGAAIATITGQIVSALFAGYYLFHTKSFKLKKESFKLDGRILRRMLPLGVSSFLTQISIVVSLGVINNTLVAYGASSRFGADIPMTVVGIVFKLFQIVVAIVVGIAVGAQPIVGFNYGAGMHRRVKQTYKTMIKAEIIVGVVATLAFELFPLQIIGLFGAESALYNEFAVFAFRAYLCTMILCCVQKATSIFLQSLGKPVMSMGLSLLRDFVISVPAILILPKFFGVKGPLYSAPIADVISMIAVVLMMVKVWKQLNLSYDVEEEEVTNEVVSMNLVEEQ